MFPLHYSVTVTVNGYDLFLLMVISITVTVNLNHTAALSSNLVVTLWTGKVTRQPAVSSNTAITQQLLMSAYDMIQHWQV